VDATGAAGATGAAARVGHGHKVTSASIFAAESGTAFPTGAALTAFGNNRPFFRTDLGEWYYYDGTRWLGPEQRIALPYASAQSNTDNRQYTGDSTEIFEWAPLAYDVLVTAVDIAAYDTTGGSTTANYHQLDLYDGFGGTHVYNGSNYGLTRNAWNKWAIGGGWSLPFVLHAANVPHYFNLGHNGTVALMYLAAPILTIRRIAT
jgi:hypothetical protein